MRIASIAERPDLVATVAHWQFATWGHLEPETSLAMWAASLERQAAHPDTSPPHSSRSMATNALGAASVVREEAHGALTPRLACVYVLPAARGRGVATGLVRHVMAQMEAFGVSRLYLVTEGARGLYEKIGWQAIGTSHHAGMEMTTMTIDLAPYVVPAPSGE